MTREQGLLFGGVQKKNKQFKYWTADRAQVKPRWSEGHSTNIRREAPAEVRPQHQSLQGTVAKSGLQDESTWQSCDAWCQVWLICSTRKTSLQYTTSASICRNKPNRNMDLKSVHTITKDWSLLLLQVLWRNSSSHFSASTYQQAPLFPLGSWASWLCQWPSAASGKNHSSESTPTSWYQKPDFKLILSCRLSTLL